MIDDHHYCSQVDHNQNTDYGTHPKKVSLNDVMLDSIFHKGYDWMWMDVSEGEEAGYITHTSKPV